MGRFAPGVVLIPSSSGLVSEPPADGAIRPGSSLNPFFFRAGFGTVASVQGSLGDVS